MKNNNKSKVLFLDILVLISLIGLILFLGYLIYGFFIALKIE
ncbi:MAG: hypothetical protein AABW91_04555 [Nanoarchaeota archaeon]